MSIRAYDNIPLLSYLLLLGKCRSCKAGIPIRYPSVELINGLLYVAVLWRFGIGVQALPYLAFCSALVVITFIDLDFQIIPDRITLPGIVLGLIAGSFIAPDPFTRTAPLGLIPSLTGFLVGGGLFYAIAILSRGGMGGGDIKMMAMVGGLTGWKSVLLTTFAGSVAGSVFGIGLMLLKGKGRKTKIPFGPFLAGGALVAVFFGREIFHWYFRH
jgi:leader peptidase (prepilin peptidase) / N-methyltransferase